MSSSRCRRGWWWWRRRSSSPSSTRGACRSPTSVLLRRRLRRLAAAVLVGAGGGGGGVGAGAGGVGGSSSIEYLKVSSLDILLSEDILNNNIIHGVDMHEQKQVTHQLYSTSVFCRSSYRATYPANASLSRPKESCAPNLRIQLMYVRITT